MNPLPIFSTEDGNRVEHFSRNIDLKLRIEENLVDEK